MKSAEPVKSAPQSDITPITAIINIFIIEEQLVVSRGLQLIIDATPDMFVAGQVHSTSEALHKISLHSIDVIVFDIIMNNGFELLLLLKRDYPQIPILILSHHCEDAISLRLIRDGAAGCLCKTRSAEELIFAIRKMYTSGKFITEGVAVHLAEQVRSGSATSPRTLLSVREFQVFQKLSSGTDSKDVARELFLSPKTVSTYKRRVLDKLKCKNISELTRYALSDKAL